MKKIFHKFCGLIIMSGCLLLMLTAGASDNNMIGLAQIFIQQAISIGLIGLGAIGLKTTGFQCEEV